MHCTDQATDVERAFNLFFCFSPCILALRGERGQKGDFSCLGVQEKVISARLMAQLTEILFPGRGKLRKAIRESFQTPK